MASTSGEESQVGFRPMEEKLQLDCLIGNWGPVLALPPSNQTTGEGEPRGVAGSDPIPSTRPAAPLASGLLLTPGHTSEAKEPAPALGLGLSPVTGVVLGNSDGCHPASAGGSPAGLWLPPPYQGTHQHHSAHPVFGERLLCASGRLLRRHRCSGCRTTSTPQDWAP